MNTNSPISSFSALFSVVCKNYKLLLMFVPLCLCVSFGLLKLRPTYYESAITVSYHDSFRDFYKEDAHHKAAAIQYLPYISNLSFGAIANIATEPRFRQELQQFAGGQYTLYTNPIAKTERITYRVISPDPEIAHQLTLEVVDLMDKYLDSLYLWEKDEYSLSAQRILDESQHQLNLCKKDSPDYPLLAEIYDSNYHYYNSVMLILNARVFDISRIEQPCQDKVLPRHDVIYAIAITLILSIMLILFLFRKL